MCTCAIQVDDPDGPVVAKTNRMLCSLKWRDMPQNQGHSIQLDCDLKLKNSEKVKFSIGFVPKS